MSKQERRKDKRHIQKNNPFEHYDAINNGDNTTYGRIIDISEGGVKLETNTKIKVGSELSAKIELPYKYLSKTAISLEIICRWSSDANADGKFEAGFEFIDKSVIDTIFMMKILGLSRKERVLLTVLGSSLDFSR